MRAVEHARAVLPASSVLRILRLSASRYNAWIRAERGCRIDDHASCPRSTPSQLTPDEVFAIGQMVPAEQYRHVPTGRLAMLAQRLGKVFASPSTWYTLVRARGWRRPRLRQHPESPKVGVRAEKPDEIWHIDTSSVRLVDGAKVWLHAVIDNFSRKVLAGQPQVMTDGGVENFNGEVAGLIGKGLLHRVRALVDVRFSNSMIESW